MSRENCYRGRDEVTNLSPLALPGERGIPSRISVSPQEPHLAAKHGEEPPVKSSHSDSESTINGDRWGCPESGKIKR
jgi:hypothetical protein